jgi:hypothetical protein
MKVSQLRPGGRKKGAAPAQGDSAPPQGSGPGGRIEIGDIRDKLEEIRGEIHETTDGIRPYLTYAAVAGAVIIVAVAFLAGRSRGKSKATWVEVRRL